MQYIKEIILFLILVAVLAFTFGSNMDRQKDTNNENIQDQFSVVGPNKDDLIEFSVKPGSVVTGKFEATGIVKNAYFFEANILVNLLDANQNLLKAGNGTATTDWMTIAPVSFATNIDATGLTGPGYIEIRNDDPSDGEGGPAKIILIPVVFQ